LTVLAQLSDPHIEVGPGDAGSSEAFAAAVAAVLRLDPLPDAVLVSGDITNCADARAYERARELLAPLPMPAHVLPGNHDEREALRTWFTDDPVAGAHSAPFQYALMCGALRLVVCDTTQPGRADGRLDAGAITWLEGRLAEAPETPTIVAMHHPPLLTGIGGLDAIGLPESDRTALGAVLARAAQVRRVVAGHVHRGAFGVLSGCGVFACASVFQHARLELRPDAEIALSPGHPAFGVHALLAGGEVVSHVVAIDAE
jgi:3',5'-cyclic-AMP phosphodiesterase